MSNSHLHVVRVSLIVQLQVPEALFASQFPASIKLLGGRVAQQVIEFCEREKLNYFPALDFIQQQQAVDAFLLDAIKETADTAILLCTSEVQKLLTPVYSNVHIESAQCLAYSMPGCRPGGNAILSDSDKSPPETANVQQQLAHHYTPDTIKLQLTLSLIQKHEPGSEIQKYVSETAYRWLDEVFPAPVISAVRIVD